MTDIISFISLLTILKTINGKVNVVYFFALACEFRSSVTPIRGWGSLFFSFDFCYMFRKRFLWGKGDLCVIFG